MRIILNNHIPIKGFMAMNFFGILFVRRAYYTKLDAKTMNHEYIHSEQMKELLYLPFYIIYVLEFLFLLCRYRDMKKAYRHISFEKEAHQHQEEYDYLLTRKHFAQWKTT